MEVRRAGVIGEIDVFEVREVAGADVAEAFRVEAAGFAALRVGEVRRTAGCLERHGIMVLHDGSHQWAGIFSGV